MKIYDISQEVMGCVVYPGDPEPRAIPVARMQEGSLYNLTKLEMCAHNGTHVDAPYHFYQEGKAVDQMALEKTVGWCYVTALEGHLTQKDAEQILEAAKREHPEAYKRLLFKGNAVVTAESAAYLAEQGIELVGVESQTVGPEDSPMQVHLILLGREVCLLEGLRLGNVPEGVYFLHAAPLNLSGFDGAPCRATLTKF